MNALEQESDILRVLDESGITNPKKLVKLATQLHNQSPHELQRKLCLEIIRSPRPVEYIQHCIQKIKDFAEMVQFEVKQGNHGMLIVGPKMDIIIPIKLDLPASWVNDGTPWIEDDERDIMRQAAENYLRNSTRKYLLAKVVLFPEFGFSGIPRVFEFTKEDFE